MLGAKLTNARRLYIYDRDGFRCVACDSTRYLQIHHYIPRGKGGQDNEMNLVTLCSDCHCLAHGHIPHDWQDESDIDEVDYAIVEHLADYYARAGYIWNPK